MQLPILCVMKSHFELTRIVLIRQKLFSLYQFCNHLSVFMGSGQENLVKEIFFDVFNHQFSIDHQGYAEKLDLKPKRTHILSFSFLFLKKIELSDSIIDADSKNRFPLPILYTHPGGGNSGIFGWTLNKNQ